MKNKKRHITILIINCVIFCTCIFTYGLLSTLKLTTESNPYWYETLLSLGVNISSYVLVWYIGFTWYYKGEKNNENKNKERKE